ncbi:MAG: aspartyl protease family protein, partial [Candidatus Aminicenantes bacterium]|nr:aspartyl protease family protein [Candidatus Aminicenantes bacterium]
EAGVLFQASRVVGWTFGEETESGYLWAGPGEGDLVPNLGADRVFGTVVADGREVGFFRALALGDEADAAERLSAFAQGYRSAPLLRDEDLPFRFRTPSIVGRMYALSTDLVRTGRARDVVRILDEGVLTEAADPELVKAAVLAQARDRDYNRAIQYLDRLKKTVFEAQGRDASTIEPFRAQLYKDWLREILDKGGYFSAQVAYEEAARAFPDDPEIRLLGVEVALAENNPEKAKELLRARDIPPLLKDRVDQLAARIKTQEDEQELVIPFNPAQNRIILEAKLNGTYRLRFLVDTGAMMSSIPSAAASALGIEVDQTTPIRAVTTASGIVLVYEVFLNSIDVLGYRVENMKVLLLDLPADSTIGILGMDFLNNFRYEIDNKAGVFRLRKK